MGTLIALLLQLFLLPALLATGYLLALGLAALIERTSGTKATGGRQPTARFQVLVPAHNEETMIAETVTSIIGRQSDAGLPARVAVVADNCTDTTAQRAREAGAEVLERHDTSQRGKGHSLRWAHDILRQREDWDVLLVVDADTLLDVGFFQAMGQAFAQPTTRAAQAHYAARASRQGTWRAHLQEVAWSVFNCLRPMGRNAIGGTSPILGNGFALHRQVLEQVPFQAVSQVEDVEQGLILLTTAGERVQFVPAARVLGQVEEQASTARSQRTRWERGRMTLAAAWIPRLLTQPGRCGAWPRIEAAIDLAVPPLALLAIWLTVGSVASLLLMQPAVAATGLIALGFLLLLTLEGMWLAGVPWGHLWALVHVPSYLAWKMSLYLNPSFWREARWVRTRREDGPKP